MAEGGGSPAPDIIIKPKKKRLAKDLKKEDEDIARRSIKVSEALLMAYGLGKTRTFSKRWCDKSRPVW